MAPDSAIYALGLTEALLLSIQSLAALNFFSNATAIFKLGNPSPANVVLSLLAGAKGIQAAFRGHH